ncbi:MAG: PQQ-binding-like beta-propeller repeat protein [Verrucomicrobiota bacterium]
MPWFFITVLSLNCFTFAALAEWPQFRGPTGSGISGATGFPVTWSETQNVKWKTAIPGRGWSSPVIFGNEIWMTTANPKGTELSVVCVERESGKIIHDRKIFDVEAPQFVHEFNSYASPTPVIEAGRLYASWGSPGIACIDTKTAKVLWERRDFICNHYRGAGSSVTIFENLLIHHFDGSDFQFVVALDKITGKTVWRTERSVDFKDLMPDGKPDHEGDWRKAFSTPRIFQVDGNPLLLSQGSKAFYGYEPRTGKELWRVESSTTHTTSTTPVSDGRLIYLCTGNAKGEVWAVRPGGSGVVSDTHIVWKYSRAPMRPSLLLANDLIFMVDDGGVATCIESKTGKELWRERVGGNYSASPLFAEGRIYFFSEEGKATVIEAGREWKPIATNQLGDGFMASAAVDGKALILRTKTGLYRVEAR